MRLLMLFLLLPFCLSAQTKKTAVAVDKKGLVLVWGKNAFYIKSKGAVPWESDYIIENLQHEQLAYLKLTKGYHYTNNTNSHQEVQYYEVTFNNGAHCELRDYMKYNKSITTALAIVFVNNALIMDDKLNMGVLGDFVTANNGSMTPIKHDTTTGIHDSAIPHADDDSLNGNITMKDGQIYYDQQAIGSYKKIDIDVDFVSIQVYSINKNKVAEVTHETGNAEWRITTVVDQKRETLPYNKSTALPDLFRYLLKKRYL